MQIRYGRGAGEVLGPFCCETRPNRHCQNKKCKIWVFTFSKDMSIPNVASTKECTVNRIHGLFRASSIGELDETVGEVS